MTSNDGIIEIKKDSKPSEPVICLGLKFANEEERRNHFKEKLRQKLLDPEFRKIEGFPIGSDEDILNLSDPPYYTACPNPWIAEFVTEWEAQKPEQPDGYHYHREPFAFDVAEGKYDPFYKMHPYPTKVPHKAIMRYILHYTNPGDIVFDGFCGTGMTGVAAQMCGDRDAIVSLGFQVKPDGTILREEHEDTGKTNWVPFSKIGARRAVLNDLSPAAGYISYNYNTPLQIADFEKESGRILKEVEEESLWMYATKHSDGRIGKINYMVWSDVFICQECLGEVIFWDCAVNKQQGTINDIFPCPHCSSELTKRNMERAWVTRFDPHLKETVRQAKQTPVKINYSVGSSRFEKTPDKDDLDTIEKTENIEIPKWFPVSALPDGFNTSQPIRSHGITHLHHFYSNRNLWVLASYLSKCTTPSLRLVLTKVSGQITKRYRFTYQSGVWGAGGGPQSGTLYIPSLVKELNIIEQMKSAIKDRITSGSPFSSKLSVISTSSATNIQAGHDGVLDYIFIDPPFGSNIMYSELALLWEEWLGVKTNSEKEAIENSFQNKGVDEYRKLMSAAFERAYKLLKPGRWMTVEFSNTKAAVWNSIQTALTEAGFIVASVSALDKKKGSFKAVTTPTAVKQDLVISAYKPNGGFEERFQNEAQTEEGVWDFVRTHLKYLPITKRDPIKNTLIPVTERDPRIIFDQLVAFYVRKGFPIPMDSGEFQTGLSKFPQRDGLFFLSEQVSKYDRAKMLAKELEPISLFICDESSAIAWLRQKLKDRPQTYQELHPQFTRELGGWSKNEQMLELSKLLEQNFLCYDSGDSIPEQIHAYLSSNWKELRNLSKQDPALIAKAKNRWYIPDPNKARDIEKLRERDLLRDFENYKQSTKKLKVFRIEAIRSGFKKAWQEKNYAMILQVAEKIPTNILEEDPKLLMWFDSASTRIEDTK